MNARFWVWLNEGPVKLTLRPEEYRTHFVENESKPRKKLISWRLEPSFGGKLIRHELSSTKVGTTRHFTDHVSICHITQLHSCPVTANDVATCFVKQEELRRYPKWVSVSTESRVVDA